MLLNQIDALGDVSGELRKVNSLLTLLSDYFKEANPEVWELHNRYETYQDLVCVVGDIVYMQKKCIDEATIKLDAICTELKRLGELI